MKLVLTGVTGVVPPSRRAHVHIALLTRRAVPDWAVLPPNAASKTTTIIHADFTAYSPELAARLAEHDACIWALGRSSMGMTEEEYTATTYTSVMNAARALRDAGVGAERPADKPFRFVYISGEHANPEGKSRQMWARVKYPQDRQNQRSATLGVVDNIMYPVLKCVLPTSYTTTENLATFTVELAKGLGVRVTSTRQDDRTHLQINLK
ncbi:hypothetical protein FOMPIDRAFT_113025 [Fomitopsis schrenkii]|uniref:NAD(P)-binding domain-containing protein n=1 Tax=Fomitopsis schrenkii TaxID=2126942 RepID=S8FG57_FOMSC|nr:hypothetical protein FOMPIDRAFT_113025 [Fomitopsis schrenkii]